MEHISGIYIIRSQIKPARFYIGSSVNIKSRWGNHLFSLRKNIHHSHKMQRHYNKYGLSDLIFEVLISCDRQALLKTEQEFLDICAPYFNECPLANSSKGRKDTAATRRKRSKIWKGKKRPPFSEDWKKHMSECRIGKKHTKEHNEKIGKARVGKARSEETKRKISEKAKGRVMSEERRRKISETLKGRKLPEFTEEHKRHISEGKKGHKCPDHVKEKLSKDRKGRKLTEEWKLKIGLGSRGHKLSDEAKLKISKTHKGKPKSEEHKRKLSEALKGNKNRKAA